MRPSPTCATVSTGSSRDFRTTPTNRSSTNSTRRVRRSCGLASRPTSICSMRANSSRTRSSTGSNASTASPRSKSTADSNAKSRCSSMSTRHACSTPSLKTSSPFWRTRTSRPPRAICARTGLRSASAPPEPSPRSNRSATRSSPPARTGTRSASAMSRK